MFKDNKAQTDVIQTIYGPVIVISCPGSGKTTTLIRRIRHMIELGINPANIIMVTFTNNAAKDMNKKYMEKYGENPGVLFCTIHSLCFNILRKEGYCYELVDERKKWYFIYNLVKDNSHVGDPNNVTTAIVTEISSVKNNDIPLEIYEPTSCNRTLFLGILKKYETEKKNNNKIDFDDILLMCRRLLMENPAVRRRWQEQFRFIQCDEYQDVNAVQRDILYILAGESANLCVVGDDDQSIYRFRGARSSIMMNFMDDFRGKEPKMFMMSTNYRSGQKIVDTADACISYNKVRFEKAFISDRGKDGFDGTVKYMNKMKSKDDELHEVLKTIMEKHREGVPYEEMAILFRINRQALLPVQKLSSFRIPFCSTEKVESIYDQWIYKDILAYIELGMNINTKENMLRVLNRPNRYFSKKDFENAEYSEGSMLDAVSYYNDRWRRSEAVSNISKWMTYFGPGKITENTPCGTLFSRLSAIGYAGSIDDTASYQGEDVKEAREKYLKLREDAEKCGTVGKWMEHAKEEIGNIRNFNTKNSKNGVVVSTMHKAKGQEWKIVFLIDVDEEVIPYTKAKTPEEIEEERRLLYVGMTRAKDELYIFSCIPSPFMHETQKKIAI